MTARPTLPQNYMKNAGTLLNIFDSTTGWTLVGPSDGQIAVDNENFKDGTSGLKFTIVTQNGTSMYRRVLDSPINMRDVDQLDFYMYVADSVTLNRIVSVGIELSDWPRSQGFGVTKTFTTPITGLSTQTLKSTGWTAFSAKKSELGAFGGATWDSLSVGAIKITVTGSGGTPPHSITFDSYRYNHQRMPRFLMTFDDFYESVYTEAYAYMQPRGIVGTFYVAKNFVGEDGYITLAQLQEMYASGWTIANHGESHVSWATLSDAQVTAELVGCKDWLVANGMPNGAVHHAYPYGVYTDAIIADAQAAGMITARTCDTNFMMYPFGDWMKIPYIGALQNTATFGAIKPYIDYINKYGMMGALLVHQIAETPEGLEVPRAEFRAIIDYLAATKTQCATVDEAYHGLTNPRYRSLPLTRA